MASFRTMTTVDVGKSPTLFQRREVNLVRFHGFPGLPVEKGHATMSPEFTCFGHKWRLKVIPGGDTNASDGMVSIYLQHRSSCLVNIAFDLIIMGKDGKAVHETNLTSNTTFSSESRTWGYKDFAKLSDIMDGALLEETLIVKVDMKLLEPINLLPFVPKNPTKNILDMFLHEPADLVFEVDREEQPRRKTRASYDPSQVKIFHAHRLVVEQFAPLLAKEKLRGAKSDGDVARVLISNVSPQVFGYLLHFMYGGKVSDEDLKAQAKDIIETANRFGMIHLKQAAEAWYVKTASIGEDNMKMYLQFASATKCALLKEAVADFIVKSGCEIPDSLTQKERDGLDDNILAITRRREKKSAGGDQVGTMRVSELREKLEEKGLNIDGSRKDMIKTLRENAKTVDAIEGKLKSMKL